MTRSWVVLALVSLLSTTAFADGDDEEPPVSGKAKAKAAPKAASDEPEAAAAPAGDDDAPTPKQKGGDASVSASSGDLIPQGAPKGRMTLPGGKFMFNVVTEVNMAKGASGKPLSIAPDLWIGMADKLTVGVYHSGRAATGFLSGFGTGLCLRGGDMGGPICGLGLGDVYTFVGGEARVGLLEGGFPVAFVVGASVRFIDPEKLVSGKAGFLARLHTKMLGIELAPMVLPGITKRKVGGMDFNTDIFVAPVTIFIRFAPRVALALQGGITFQLKHAGDTYRVPAAAGLSVWLTKHISFDAAFGLAAVADKDTMTKAFDQRSVTVGLGYAN